MDSRPTNGRFGDLDYSFDYQGDKPSETVTALFDVQQIFDFASSIGIEVDRSLHGSFEFSLRPESSLEVGHWIVGKFYSYPIVVLGRITAFVHVFENIEAVLDDLHCSWSDDLNSEGIPGQFFGDEALLHERQIAHIVNVARCTA